MKKQIIIIGGGFGGLTTAVRVAKSRRKNEGCRVTVIDKHPRHLYYPLIYEIATGFFDGKPSDSDEVRHCEDELRAGASIPFEEIASSLCGDGVRFRYAEVVGVDWTSKSVLCADGCRIPYDELAIAMGSVSDTFGIEGLDIHAHTLYSLRGALSIRRRLYSLLQKKRRGEIPFIRIIVGGAGPTGVEFACETAVLFRKLVRKGFLKRSEYSITVIDVADRPVRNLQSEMSAWVLKRFEALDIRFLSDTLIKSTHRNHITISSKKLSEGDRPEAHIDEPSNEKEIIHELLVWTGGSKASPTLASFGIPLTKKGKIEVDEMMRVRGKEHVWAFGDCAAMTNPKTGHLVPPLAQTAIHQGERVAKNILATCEGRPLGVYHFPPTGIIIPLGGAYGIADIFGFKLRGRIVYPIKLAVEGRYFFKTLPPRIAWRTFLSAFRAYRKND